MLKKISKWCGTHLGTLTFVAILVSLLSTLGKEKVLEAAKFLFIKGMLWLPLTVFLFLNGLAKFCDSLDKHLENKKRREEERERKEREILEEPRRKWLWLTNELGFSVGWTKNLIGVSISEFPEPYKNQQKTFIRYFREFGFFMPSEAEMLKDDFLESWLNFLLEFFEAEEIHKRYPDAPPTEKRFLTLWETIKQRKKD